MCRAWPTTTTACSWVRPAVDVQFESQKSRKKYYVIIEEN
jgi:hypothetical protein